MKWTRPADLRAQVQKLWDRGLILSSMIENNALFPKRLALKGPSSSDLSERFEEAHRWIAELAKGAHYRVEMREFRHRILGSNSIPGAVWIDSLDDALALIGKRQDSKRFAKLIDLNQKRQPGLTPWLAKHPIKALQLFDDWPRLLDVIEWIQSHPRPGVYLRQVDIPGVHTKFIEAHRGTLTGLLDLVLHSDAVNDDAVGISKFARRYGFRDKPTRLRFRILDPELYLLPGRDLDITVTQETFATLHTDSRMDGKIDRVFITENEVNFLALPNMPGSVVIFGAGYGFDALSEASWLQTCDIHYWGDIDTHGFAILDQLRSRFPQARSLLMDQATLMAHQALWGIEPKQETRDLPRLNYQEQELYNSLRDHRIGVNIRLEQEKIRFSWVAEALRNKNSI